MNQKNIGVNFWVKLFLKNKENKVFNDYKHLLNYISLF